MRCAPSMRLSCASISSSTEYFVSTDTAPPDTYTLSLHDALPISLTNVKLALTFVLGLVLLGAGAGMAAYDARSEEHTSELQSRENLVCRLLLEKKNWYRRIAVGCHSSPEITWFRQLGSETRRFRA